MNDKELLQDFGDYIAERARKKVDAPKVEPVEAKEEVFNEETNLFNASMGLKFKCGICKGYHRSSSPSALAKIDLCARKLKRVSRNEIGGLIFSDDYKSITLERTIRDHVSDAKPGNVLFVNTHKKFLAEVDKISDRINERFVRNITKTIPVIEALGSPDPVKHLKAIVKEYHRTFDEANAKSAEEQRAFAGPVYESLKNWLTLKPERAKFEKQSAEITFYKAPGQQVLKSVFLNGTRIYAQEIAACFETFNVQNCLFVSNPKEDTTSYVIDVDIWKDGFPAMLWTTRVLRGYNHNARHRYDRHKKAKVLFGVVLFSTWDRKVYLVNANTTLVKKVETGYLSEIVMPKDERDYRSGAYFENL